MLPSGVPRNPEILCPQCKGRHRVLTLAVRSTGGKDYGKYFCKPSRKIVYKELESA